MGRRLIVLRLHLGQNIYKGLTAANLDAFFYLWGTSMTSLTGPNTGLVDVEGDTVAASG